MQRQPIYSPVPQLLSVDLSVCQSHPGALGQSACLYMGHVVSQIC